jgi:hypothetical protein
MKKVIIGIHGLGNKPPKYMLQKWWKDAMHEGLNAEGINRELPIFELVYWADLLYEKPLNKWEKDKYSPYYLDEPYKKASKKYAPKDYSTRKKVMDYVIEKLKKVFLNEDKTLNFAFISEVIMRRYFRDLEIYYTEECNDIKDRNCKVRDTIRARVVQVIKKYANCDIMIIAHSMGSIIAFDVLSVLVPEAKINTLVTIGSPLGIPIVISKTAAEQKKKLNGKSVLATPSGVMTNWYNIADILDHVAFNYKLADDFKENDRGITPIDLLVTNNYEANGLKNPHKSFGYLRTPEFAKILEDFIGVEEKNIAQKIMHKVQGMLHKVKEKGAFVKDKLNID